MWVVPNPKLFSHYFVSDVIEVVEALAKHNPFLSKNYVAHALGYGGHYRKCVTLTPLTSEKRPIQYGG